jgi:hypothetical protein
LQVTPGTKVTQKSPCKSARFIVKELNELLSPSQRSKDCFVYGFVPEDPFVLAALRPFLPALAVSIMVSSAANAFADSWVKPTPEELQMTAEPAAPGGAAIYLLRDARG